MKILERKEADLHMHSHYSDGDCDIEELVKRIKEAGLKAAVLTDHDKIDGTRIFLKYCEIENISSSTGIEITTSFTQSPNVESNELHILGYGFNIKKMFEYGNFLAHNLNQRYEHILAMIDLYSKSGEFIISSEEIIRMFKLPNTCLTNRYWLHKARALDLIKKSCNKIDFRAAYIEATQEIKDGERFYAPKGEFIRSQTAISLINACGGIAVLAHPVKYLEDLKLMCDNPNKIFKKTLSLLRSSGLYGIEVYTRWNMHMAEELLRYCDKFDLCPNFGGSDYHGDKPNEHQPGEYLGKGGIDYKKFMEIMSFY